MSLKPRFLAALVIVGAPLAVIEACTFPDVTFEPSTVASEAGTNEVEASSSKDVATDGDAGRERPKDVDPDGGGSGDAATRGDATIERPDAEAGAVGCAGAGGTPCDCDSDKALNGAPGCSPPAGEVADCDDFDPLVDPKAGFVAAEWDPRSPHTPAYDWNCDGKVIKQFDYGVKCGLADCTQGFAEDIPCGATGTYNICKGSVNVLGVLTLCSVGSTEPRTQGCR